MRHCVSVLVAGWAVSAAVTAAPLALHVAPTGNDRWSGKLATPSPQGNDGPLLTLSAALQAARGLRATPAARDGIAIRLQPGVYPLAETLQITAADSGVSAEAPLLITGTDAGRPVLSGGKSITGWKRVPGSGTLWQAEVPEVQAGKWYFRQLFVDGKRQQRARTPNSGFYRIQGDSPQDKPVKLRFKPGEIKKEWATDGDVEVVAFLAWADLRMQIRAVDEAAGVATLAGNPSESNRENNAQYFIENAPDGLDQPGEWYLDRKRGVVTYWPEAGVDMGKAQIIAPYLTELIRIASDPGIKETVHHLVFRGLTFAHTDWELAPEGYADVQAAVSIQGDIRANRASDCTVADCLFTQLGGYGLELGKGCQRWRVVGNEMVDLGAGGIRIGDTALPKQAAEECQGHLISDNHLHRLGRVYAPAIGVFVMQSGQNRIAYNHIHDLYYTAVSVGWNWGYQETPCRANIVEFNHLHDIGQNLLSDMGAVYTLGIQEGTVIRNNLVHDVSSFTYGGWGLYTDEGSTHILLENNVVYRTKSAGFHQHYGKENTVRNNIFAFGREHQLMRSRAEKHTSFFFTNNIVYFDSGDLLGSNWSNDHYVIDRNLYFDARPGADAKSLRFADASLEDWRKRGHDLNSRIGNPLFAAPKECDFRLKPGSPAIELGFKPINVSGVGVRKRADWGK